MADLDPKLLEQARELGVLPLLGSSEYTSRRIAAFAQTIREQERERCTKVAEDWSQSVANQPYKAWAWAIAAAIREGKE